MPEELVISVYCEEFNTRPVVAARDLYGWDQRDEPAGLSLRVIETRSFVRAYEKLKEAKDDPNADFDEDSPIYKLVREIGGEYESEAKYEEIRTEMDKVRSSMVETEAAAKAASDARS